MKLKLMVLTFLLPFCLHAQSFDTIIKQNIHDENTLQAKETVSEYLTSLGLPEYIFFFDQIIVQFDIEDKTCEQVRDMLGSVISVGYPRLLNAAIHDAKTGKEIEEYAIRGELLTIIASNMYEKLTKKPCFYSETDIKAIMRQERDKLLSRPVATNVVIYGLKDLFSVLDI